MGDFSSGTQQEHRTSENSLSMQTYGSEWILDYCGDSRVQNDSSVESLEQEFPESYRHGCPQGIIQSSWFTTENQETFAALMEKLKMHLTEITIDLDARFMGKK